MKNELSKQFNLKKEKDPKFYKSFLFYISILGFIITINIIFFELGYKLNPIFVPTTFIYFISFKKLFKIKVK